MKAQICPKCNGQGVVNKPPWIAGDQDTWTSTNTTHLCDVCNGSKVLYLPDGPFLSARYSTPMRG